MTAASTAVMLNVAPQQAGMTASIKEISYELDLQVSALARSVFDQAFIGVLATAAAMLMAVAAAIRHLAIGARRAA